MVALETCRGRSYALKRTTALSPYLIRACSSVGRAPALQAGCRKFDPCQVHQFFLLRDREVATRQAHNLKIGGANPSPATKLCGSGREAQYKSPQNSKAVGSNPTFHSKFAPSLCT